MKRIILIAVFTFVLSYVLLCFALFFYQRSLIYFPQPRAEIKDTVILHWPVDGAEINITAQIRPGSNAVLYFGGNGEDTAWNMPQLRAVFPDESIYLVHYRGYGGSSGKPTEKALVADALSIFDKIYVDHKNVLVIGRSLGTGVATQLASTRPISKLVLVTPFDSVLNIASGQFPIFPISVLLQDKYESWKFAEKITAPTLIVIADRDEVIPRSSTDALITHFQSSLLKVKVFKNAGHNTISDDPDYFPSLKE